MQIRIHLNFPKLIELCIQNKYTKIHKIQTRLFMPYNSRIQEQFTNFRLMLLLKHTT